MPLGLQGLQPHTLTVLFKSLPMVNLSIQHCNSPVLAEKPFTCVGIMEPSRKCRLILSRGALSRSSSPLLVTQSPWEVKEHTWYKHSDQVTIRSVLALSLTESHRVIVVPQTLREVTIHVVHSRIQHWCHQQTLPPHELLVDAVGFHVFGKPFEYVKLCTPETHGIHESVLLGFLLTRTLLVEPLCVRAHARDGRECREQGRESSAAAEPPSWLCEQAGWKLSGLEAVKPQKYAPHTVGDAKQKN